MSLSKYEPSPHPAYKNGTGYCASKAVRADGILVSCCYKETQYHLRHFHRSVDNTYNYLWYDEDQIQNPPKFNNPQEILEWLASE